MQVEKSDAKHKETLKKIIIIKSDARESNF